MARARQSQIFITASVGGQRPQTPASIAVKMCTHHTVTRDKAADAQDATDTGEAANASCTACAAGAADTTEAVDTPRTVKSNKTTNTARATYTT